MATVTPKVCILVVSHNFRELTNELCRNIVVNTQGVPYKLHVIETGSHFSKFSQYATLWTAEKIRMTRGWNVLRDYADRLAAAEGYAFDAYHLFVNDAHFLPQEDMVSTLYQQMMSLPDCGQIHPYQTNIREAGKLLRRQFQQGTRKVSFSEIVCPMIRAEAWRKNPGLLDDAFFYGWGLDYDMPHQLHQSGYRCYVSDAVGVTHHAGTTYHHADVTEEALRYNEFQAKARQNMYERMNQKYSDAWPRVLLDGVPHDVDPQAMFDWLVGSERDHEDQIRSWKRPLS